MRNFYEVLGIDLLGREASEDEIRSAYRVLVKELHPDLGGDAEAFRELQFAYDVLSDPVKRVLYDEKGETAVTANRQQEIEDTILGFAENVFALAPAGTRDLVAALREKIASSVENAQADATAKQGDLDRLRKIKVRLTYHEGPGRRDILAGFFEKKELEIERQITTAEHAVEIGNEAIAYLGAYVDRGQAPALSFRPFGGIAAMMAHEPDCVCWTCCPN